MKSQKIYCVSHEPPLVPDKLFDCAIGIGDYRPTRGAHISALSAFWDVMRPLSYGAAGNYAIPRAIELDTNTTELTGIFSRRKMVLRSMLGRQSAGDTIYRELSINDSLLLPVEEVRPNEDFEFLIAGPRVFTTGVIQHYVETHHALDMFEYLTIAVQIGELTASDANDFAAERIFIPGGCELGIYPTPWLQRTLRRLEAVGRAYVTQCASRIRTYDNYQVRAVGFLAERLGSFFLLQELRSRYAHNIPHQLIGHLCVIVPEGSAYHAARVGN